MSDFAQERKGETGAAVEHKTPRLYAVILHNDDFTAMDFVVMLLMKVFHKDAKEAAAIMLSVHEKGEGTAGIYPFDIAVTKKLMSEKMAEEKGFPLRLSLIAEE